MIDKRVLIDGRRGKGGRGNGNGNQNGVSPLALSTTTTLDARGNTPALRFRRAAAVVGLNIDATGFREAVRVDSLSPSSGTSAFGGALLAGCSVSSSGDDGVVVAGKLSLLTLVDCEIRAGKAGVRTFAGGEIFLKRCSVKGCGTHGLAAQALSPSSPFLSSSSNSSPLSSHLGGKISARETKISSCREEGALCSGAGSSLVLEGVEIDSCRGPAVDASGRGCSVLLRGGGGKGKKGNKIFGCSGGGLWLWQGARARVCGAGTLISCDETFAVLTDGKGTRLEIESGCCCEVRGGVKGAEAERAVVAAEARNESSENEDEGNSAAASTTKQQPRHCGPPPEVGPFRWDGPDPLRA